MNTTNAEQAASQRANVDFKPLIDHFSALEYATKYATKQEKGSKPFDKMIALASALNGGKRAEPSDGHRLPCVPCPMHTNMIVESELLSTETHTASPNSGSLA